MLSEQVHANREREPTCVALNTTGIAFDQIRETNRYTREEIDRHPHNSASLSGHIIGRTNAAFQWWKPGAVKGAPQNVDPALALKLDRSAGKAIAGPPPEVQTVPINPTWIPAPLVAYGPVRRVFGCSRLTLSAASIVDDVAFVDSGYVCGGLCGYGSLYALEQRDGRWVVVALAATWVS